MNSFEFHGAVFEFVVLETEPRVVSFPQQIEIKSFLTCRDYLRVVVLLVAAVLARCSARFIAERDARAFDNGAPDFRGLELGRAAVIRLRKIKTEDKATIRSDVVFGNHAVRITARTADLIFSVH